MCFKGILVPQNDIKAAASAIVKIMRDKKIRNEFSHNSFEWARDHDWSKIIPKYLEIYEK